MSKFCCKSICNYNLSSNFNNKNSKNHVNIIIYYNNYFIYYRTRKIIYKIIYRIDITINEYVYSSDSTINNNEGNYNDEFILNELLNVDFHFNDDIINFIKKIVKKYYDF